MILAFFKYCYFWIDILGVLTQTFEPAPRMFCYGVPPLGGKCIEQHTAQNKMGKILAVISFQSSSQSSSRL